MLTVLTIILGGVGGFTLLVLGGGAFFSAPAYRGQPSAHFNGKKFFNPSLRKARGLRDIPKLVGEERRGQWFRVTDVPRVIPEPEQLDSSTRIYFINHSTFLIQRNGINILTDPIFSRRASPVSFAGPARVRPPGIAFEDLPPIDLVLLSHNHYDHLDISSVKKLRKKFDPHFVVPLGVGRYLRRRGIRKVTELDWWDVTHPVDGIEVVATPAQHFSGRGMFDRDRTLWCGYVLRIDGEQLYFAGDSGYSEELFTEIGKRFKGFDCALIPIGAYKPRWFMAPIHCSPAEAVQIHRDVQSRLSIACHYGTFPMAMEGMHDPPADLRDALQAEGLEADAFRILEEGTFLEYKAAPVTPLDGLD